MQGSETFKFGRFVGVDLETRRSVYFHPVDRSIRADGTRDTAFRRRSGILPERLYLSFRLAKFIHVDAAECFVPIVLVVSLLCQF